MGDRGARLRLVVPPTDPPCAPLAGRLRVTSEAIGEYLEPLVRQEPGSGANVVVAEYSGSWAETRVLFIDLGELESSLRVEASYSTDYGDFAGAVDGRSTVHDHDGVLCFDLLVERLDSSRRIERWQFELERPIRR